jgi:hypothetical protein
MGQNEVIIAQQLQQIKRNLESRDIAKMYQLCDELKINIEKYHVDESVASRIKIIADIAQPSTSNLTLNDRVKEIEDLVDILSTKK